MQAMRRLSCSAVLGQWLCAEVMCPLTPDPSPPAGARGGLQVRWRVSEPAAVEEAAGGGGEQELVTER